MDPSGINFTDLIKQAREMREQAGRIQEKLAATVVEASSGGGMVTARVNGAMELVGIAIDPSAVDPKDIEMLQDLIVAACAAAQRKARDMASEELSKLTGGINLPGLSKMMGG